MNSSHIAQRLEELRRAEHHAESTNNAADWNRVHNMRKELLEHAESHIWSLLAEVKTLQTKIKIIEGKKGGQSW